METTTGLFRKIEEELIRRRVLTVKGNRMHRNCLPILNLRENVTFVLQTMTNRLVSIQNRIRIELLLDPADHL